MTNGAVGDVVVTQGRTLTLRYEDGEKTVVVPENAPIISYGVDLPRFRGVLSVWDQTI